MDYKYLKHLASRGGSYIHPRGEVATGLLVEELNPNNQDKILEIGCGTGATIAEISSKYDVSITGYDIMDEMLKAAGKRISYLNLSARVNLQKVIRGSRLPLDDNSYDKAYNESVMGFLDKPDIKFLLAEIYRVLKPGGIYILNESLWKEITPDEIIKNIYQSGVKDFGLAQASASGINIKSFLTLCIGAGFEPVKQIKLDEELLRGGAYRTSNVNEKFNRKVKLKSIFSPGIMIREFKYRMLIAKHKNDGEYIESWIIKLSKPK